MSKESAKKDDNEYRSALLMELAQHIGSINAVSMGKLYKIVYGKEWENLANDTRKVRSLVTTLRNEGVPICASKAATGGGYYLAAAGSELGDFLRRSEAQALKMLARNARIKKISLPDYMGQLRLDLK